MFNLTNLWKNKNLIILLILTIILFGSISYYYYTYIVQPKLNNKYIDNKEFVPNENTDSINATSSKNATLYFFYTNWCPHCKKADPEWDALITETASVVKGVNIVFRKIDCDIDTDLADKFKVE